MHNDYFMLVDMYTENLSFYRVTTVVHNNFNFAAKIFLHVV